MLPQLLSEHNSSPPGLTAPAAFFVVPRKSKRRGWGTICCSLARQSKMSLLRPKALQLSRLQFSSFLSPKKIFVLPKKICWHQNYADDPRLFQLVNVLTEFD